MTKINTQARAAARALAEHADKPGRKPLDVPDGQRAPSFASAIRRHLPVGYSLSYSTDGGNKQLIWVRCERTK